MSLYVFISDMGERHAYLAEDFGMFTDVRPSRPPLAERQVALVSFAGDAVDAIGRMTHGRKAVSFKWRVKVDELIALDDPLPFEMLLGALPASIAPSVSAAFDRPGAQLPDHLAAPVFDAIMALRPSLEDDLNHLRRISAPPERRPAAADGELIVSYERDAVGLVLDIAGLDDRRKSLLSAWDGRTDEPFVAGLTEFAALEDRAIEHDAQVFGDWDLIEHAAAGMARFESRGRRVTVINVNRAGIEKATGVDLIYYTQQYKAYVLVQYKRRERGGPNGAHWSYRPDNQFDDQLDRMRRLVESDGEPGVPYEYRLDERCCFLKFCAPVTPEAFSPDLINGAYIPLAYWDCLAASGVLKGKRGGRVLTDKTVGRYLNNTQFVDLVQASWVGSRQATSEQIGQIVSAGVHANESLILAHAASDQPRTGGS